MKIEDILKYLLNEKYIPDENKIQNKVLCRDDVRLLLNYIADLQRKEYNNSKAIEYIKQCTSSPDKYERFISTGESKILLNILEKGE